LTEKIESIYDKDINGKLIAEKIKLKSIAGNDSTFTSFHSRSGKTFSLFHILMDFNKR
jgi:hypothetical protein